MWEQVQTLWAQFREWAFQDKHKEKARQMRADLHRAFTEHPEMTGETYWQHLWFTFKMSMRFAFTSTVITLHGLFPFIFVRTASNQIEIIYRIMKSRIPVKRRQEIDNEPPFPARAHTVIHHTSSVAIIGGGFSGAMLLANLVEQADGELSIDWFESGESLATGVAYGTQDNVHLLNVRAGGMGALANNPEHFFGWLQTEEGKTQSSAIWPGHTITADSYVPRMLYAQYLRHITEVAMAKAKTKNIPVRVHHAEVFDATSYGPESQKILLGARSQEGRSEVLADAVVLATGNLPPKQFGFQAGLVNGISRYVADVWNTPEGHLFPNHIAELPESAEIFIIGTGLTMVDALLTLRARGYKGTVTALSRSGLLPCAHAESKAYPAWDLVLAPQFAPRTALGLFERLRDETGRAAAKGFDWRSVVDSLRPVTQQLWKQLPVTERRRFLGKLYTLWNIHRHRMAPELHAMLSAERKAGTLNIISGKLYYMGCDKDGLTVAYRRRATNQIETSRPELVLNCTGPEYDIAASGHTLLKNLRDRGMVTVGPLRIGIEATGNGTAKGTMEHALFPIGTLLVGELLECTAVPELRGQAEQVTCRLLHYLQLRDNEPVSEQHAAGEWI